VKGFDHAKPLTRGRFHDDPAANIGNAPGSEGFQARHLGCDIVGLDIQVNPARVIYLLHFDVEVFRSGFQASVQEFIGPGVGYRNQTERLGPERRCLIQVIGFTVYDQSPKLAFVHVLNLRGRSVDKLTQGQSIFKPKIVSPGIQTWR